LRVAIAHDYLTQRGGAERVVLSLVRAFPEAPVFTSLYDPGGTFGEFADCDIRRSSLDRVGSLRRRHRIALPLLPASFSALDVDADLTICSSSGWAHGVNARGRKVVYCYAPARWLYQPERYLAQTGRGGRVAMAMMRPRLVAWDQRAAKSADRYVGISTWIAGLISETYGIDAEVVHPPVSIDVTGPQHPPPGVTAGYALCVSRLLAYKNVDAVVRAFGHLGAEQLVVVGEGPDRRRLESLAGTNVRFVGSASEAELRWLYANAQCLVTASYEDFGLTPLEAAAFGTPTAALRFGGFLDTIREGKTGVYFDAPEPAEIAVAVRELLSSRWDRDELTRHAESFSEEQFTMRIRAIAAQELQSAV
jgi:glycosyltransferase involved in cell wall biosynthesis